MFVVLWPTTIDPVKLVQRKVALTIFGRAYFPFDHVAGVQVEAAHLARTDVDVVGAGGVAGVRAAQEAKAIRQDFKHTVGDDLLTGPSPLLDDGEHQLLLAHPPGIFDFKLFGLFEDFGHVKCLEFV